MPRTKSKAARRTPRYPNINDVKVIGRRAIKVPHERFQFRRQVARKVAAGLLARRSTRKKIRRRPGQLALQEIRKYQQSVKLFLFILDGPPNKQTAIPAISSQNHSGVQGGLPFSVPGTTGSTRGG